jgi:hypothetical protein
MQKLISLVVVVLVAAGSAAATEINTAGKIFMLEQGARSLGMAGCGTFLGEAYSGLYNPAAQVLSTDVTGSFYINPTPFFGPNYDYIAVTMGARTEFGYLGFSYMARDGIDATDYPPEEATAIMIAGKPSRRINLGIGLAFKILVTEPQRAAAIAVNENPLKAYKMAFDFGIALGGILPEATFDLRKDAFGFPVDEKIRKRKNGFAAGIAFQNFGGSVEYEDSIEEWMLPQLFRADLMWTVLRSKDWEVKLVEQAQKLLVELNEQGGYQKARDALFQAWGGGSREGGWTTRLGFEVTAKQLVSGRIGWSKNHRTGYAFNYYGLGLGRHWLRFNVALEHMPGSDADFGDELRFDLSAGLTYQQLRKWVFKDVTVENIER